jgi:hypothetical protein
VKRAYRTLQQERKKELEAKGIVDSTATPVVEDQAAQLARKNFEQEEKRLKLEVRTENYSRALIKRYFCLILDNRLRH